MLSERRDEAIEALAQGLEIDPQHRRLHELHEELGLRRRPILAFLGRSNPVNYVLGKLRFDILGPPKL